MTTGTPSGKSGWVQLAFISPNRGVQPTDKITVQFTLVGSPAHLVPTL